MGLKGLDTYRKQDEIQEVLGKVPDETARRLIIVLAIIFVVFFTISCFFKYPDRVEASITITTTNPPVNLVARQTGKIQYLFVKNNEYVGENQFLAVIENPADLSDIVRLIEKIRQCDSTESGYESVFQDFNPQLGEVQSSYLDFKEAIRQYVIFNRINYYPQKITATEAQIESMLDYRNKARVQTDLKKQELNFLRERGDRDSVLYAKGVLSTYDNESNHIQILQTMSALAANEGTISNIENQINALKESVVDFRLRQLQEKNNFTANLKKSYESLRNVISTWETNYLLKSPVDGKVVFTNYWNENQNVKAGDIVLTVMPNDKSEMKGKALLPALRAGKVKIGQRVKVKLNNYPDTEFGTVNGVIKNISEIPIGENYIVDIAFPEGLETSYGKLLPSNMDLTGTAMIVTDNLTLIERLFLPIRRILTDSLN